MVVCHSQYAVSGSLKWLSVACFLAMMRSQLAPSAAADVSWVRMMRDWRHHSLMGYLHILLVHYGGLTGRPDCCMSPPLHHRMQQSYTFDPKQWLLPNILS